MGDKYGVYWMELYNYLYRYKEEKKEMYVRR